MEFRLLGPFEVRLHGEPVVLSSPKHRTLLASLLLNVGSPVSIEELIDTIWGPHPPTDPRKVVQMYVARLRGLLADGANEPIIRTAMNGYQIDVAAECIDVLRFQRAWQRAQSASEHADAEARAVADALGEWRGEPLTDVPSDLLQRETVPRLKEQRLQMLERRLAMDLRRGSHSELIGELTSLTAQHPTREGLWASLMKALSESGRRAEALTAYQSMREHLAQELGIDPSAELQRLHASILDDGSPHSPAPRQLPPVDRWFHGRQHELAALDALTDGSLASGAVALGAIVGTAGVGKTALAVHWARRAADRFPDGQLWANLRGYEPRQSLSPEQALPGFLRALGVPDAQIPVSLDDQTALYRSLMDGRRMLVVLDNVNSPEQVRPLIPGSPGCAVVVTSRDDLAALVARDGASRIRLDVLSREESVVLVRRVLGPAADVSAVAELVELCARLPLALRLGAERALLNERPLPQVVAELRGGRQFEVLAADGDVYTALRAVFSWSYQALSAESAELFRVLGSHPGADWDVEAASALANDSHESTERLLAVLAAGHLVEVRGGRFAMHDLLRAYAVELSAQFDTADRRYSSLVRLLEHYLSIAAAVMDVAYPHERSRRPKVSVASTTLTLSDMDSALGWLDTERANLVALAAFAADHDLPQYASMFSATLLRHLITRAWNGEATAIHGHALRAATASGDVAGQAVALCGLATVHFLTARYPKALEQYRLSYRRYSEAGDRIGQAMLLCSIGVAQWMMGHNDDALQNYQQSLSLAREVGDRVTEARTLNCLALVAVRQGDDDLALDNYKLALRLAREIGDRSTEANLLCGIAYVHKRRDQTDEAFECYQHALAISRAIGDRNFELKAVGALGTIYLQWERYEEADHHYQLALELAREMGERTREADVHYEFGALHMRQKHFDQADRYFRRSVTLARRAGHSGVETAAHNGLGELSLALGQPGDALVHFESALRLARGIGERDEEARALEGIASARDLIGST